MLLKADTSRALLPGLDYLRGISILCVLIYHVSRTRSRGDLDPVAQVFFSIGWVGVDLFFGISGYLIAKILFVHQERIYTFVIKRLFRIVPLYLFAVSLYAAGEKYFGGGSLSNIWVTYLLLTGWAVPFIGFAQTPYLITWSVSVEEFAYTLLACARCWVIAQPVRLFLFGVLFCLLFRAVVVFSNTIEPNEVYYFPLARLDSIFLGSFAAVSGRHFPVSRISIGALLALSLLTLSITKALGQYNTGLATIGYTALGAVAAAWVWLAASLDSKYRGSISRLISYIGRRSYFLYLFHVFILAAIIRVQPSFASDAVSMWIVVLCVLAITLALAELSWRLFEAPLISLGRSLASRP